MMKSIFFDLDRKEHNDKYFEGLKEYIQEEERNGNTVRLPKLNEEIIAIQEKGSNLIKLYDIRQKVVTRQFKLDFADTIWLFEEDQELDRSG